MDAIRKKRITERIISAYERTGNFTSVDMARFFQNNSGSREYTPKLSEIIECMKSLRGSGMAELINGTWRIK